MECLDLNDPAWASFVDAHPGATCFHRPEWSMVLSRCYGYQGLVVVVKGAGGRIVSGLPLLQVRSLSGRRRWVCLPFSDECGPLGLPGTPLGPLIAAADLLRRQSAAGHLEVRFPISGLEWPAHLVAVTHSSPLDIEPSRLYRRLNDSARRNVRKAEGLGVKVRASGELSDVGRFYHLHVGTRHRQGVPVQPWRYFQMLWDSMIRRGHGEVLLAEHQGATVAAAVFLFGGRNITYKYGASNPAYSTLQGNTLILWRAMTRGAERGCTSFDWGRTDFNNQGLRNFKSRLGGDERALLYTRIPDGKIQIAGRGTRILHHVLTRAPVWACRATGELLYRYAG